MTAAQIFDAAKRADPRILPSIASGDFAPLLAWLRANLHAKGSRYATADIIAQVTGRPLDAATFERHIETRYLAA